MATNIGNEKLLSPRETAEALGLSENTLAKWRYQRDENSPPFVRLGGLIRYRESDLLLWLDAQAEDFVSRQRQWRRRETQPGSG
ncbi:helix-turn-helix domain-containing protein [Mycolicibacter sinensis]|uniref:helix-turn-helix domain-containing protein n=1 Tax=Mycolicibacter sinensis (strain JDM601) TaxID=875328 RepID=UPI000A9693FA|nr:helix-turn-helix domain-containing protein [Mycolicibacter sinensis]